jgi:hypothetical protein
MQPRPSFDRTLLIPIAIIIVSILGLVWLFSISDLGEALGPPTVVPTPVPFDVNAFETEVWASFPSATPTLDELLSSATEPGLEEFPEPGLETPTLESTLIMQSMTPPSTLAASTPDPSEVLAVGKHDDTHPAIKYDRFWAALKNPGTANAYRGTIHMSTSIGNEASFRFTGEGFRLGYQRGRNFGIVTVIIDGQSYRFHEQAFDLVWRSPSLSPGEHFVRIIHESGQSVNVDYIEILD